MNLKHWSAAVVLFTLIVPAASAGERGILLRTAFASAAKEKQRQPKPKRSRFVEPDFAALSAPALRKNEIRKMERALTAALFDDTVLHITLESVEQNAVDVFVWSGRVDGDDSSSVVISVKDRAMVASISALGTRYMIEPVENGAHEAFELDPAAFPNESESLNAPLGAVVASKLSAHSVTASDTGSTIDVLVVYTDDLRAALGGTSAAQAAATSAIAATNIAYQNSGVVPRVRLAGTAEVSYNEIGDISSALTQLRSTSDGIMDQVHALRDQVGADDVSMLVANGGSSCGIAYLMSSFYVVNPQFSFASNAFNVTDNDCAVGNLSFPHELGHNFGLAHDRYVSPNSDPSYSYAFGYVDSQNQFRDIMAYVNACGSCPRIQYFSNPNLTYLNRPLGISYESSPSTSAENVRALNNNALLISNWRQSVLTPVFTDDPLVVGATVVRAVHVTELRTAIDNYRALASLGAYSWTSNITAGTIVTAAQIAELRTALTPALTAFGRAATYTNPLSIGDPIRAIDLQELRTYLQ